MAWREVVNGPKYVGDLVSEQVTIGEERYQLLTLRPSDPAVPSPLAPLYEPVLLGFFPLAIRVRGFESVDRGTSAFGVGAGVALRAALIGRTTAARTTASGPR